MPTGGGDVIQSFLVGLGFDVDESSLGAFNKAIQTAALRVTALYGAINAFAGSMVYAFSKISEGFEEMGYQYHIIAPAINKAIVLRQELLKAYSAAGINIRKVIVDSIRLNMSLAKTRFAMEAIYKSVGSKFFGLLQKQSDTFRKKLYENMPYIINVLTKLVSTVFKAFDAVVQLGSRLWSILGRVYDFFVSLDSATDGWSTKILGVIAAWRLLNLSFLATPLGALLVGLASLLLLFDDYKTWQEGGNSLFDWTKFVPVIDAVTKQLAILKGVLDGIFTTIFNIGGVIVDVFQGKWGAALDRISDATDSVKQMAGSGLNAFSGTSALGFPTYNLKQAALGSGGSNSPGAKVNATFQTDVNITGVANAEQAGKAVGSAVTGVNQAGARYLGKKVAQ